MSRGYARWWVGSDLMLLRLFLWRTGCGRANGSDFDWKCGWKSGKIYGIVEKSVLSCARMHHDPDLHSVEANYFVNGKPFIQRRKKLDTLWKLEVDLTKQEYILLLILSWIFNIHSNSDRDFPLFIIRGVCFMQIYWSRKLNELIMYKAVSA
jgi:hypothetical protein